MSAPNSRMLAIGLDATSPDLVRRWMADGTMPNLGALAARGASGTVRGVDGFYVGSTWPSMYTGLDPSEHGVHYELQLTPGTYDLGRVQDGAFVRGSTLWGALDRAGLRVAALDVPLARLEPGLRGVQVVDWGGHDPFFGFQATPTEIGDDLLNRFGLSRHEGHCDIRRSGAAEYAKFVELLEHSVALRAAWTSDLLSRGGWDLFLPVFTEAHCAGHQCWHLHDSEHPAYDAEVVSTVGDPVRRVYRALDEAVGRLVSEAPGADVIVFSCHGMAHWSGAHFLFPRILERLGVTAFPAPAESAAEHGASGLARRLWRRLPESARRTARGLLRAGSTSASGRLAPPPPLGSIPSDSLCFPVRNGTCVEGIRLNLAGREPEGRLEPGARADEFCRTLRADLLEIVDERTGRPVFSRVERTSDLYAGPHLAALPDMLAWWEQGEPTGSLVVSGGEAAEVRVRSPKTGPISGANAFCRSGGHRRDGWYVTSGWEGFPRDGIVDLTELSPRMARRLGVEMRD